MELFMYYSVIFLQRWKRSTENYPIRKSAFPIQNLNRGPLNYEEEFLPARQRR